jgi:hypothetical protein
MASADADGALLSATWQVYGCEQKIQDVAEGVIPKLRS